MKIDIATVVLLICWAVAFSLWQYEMHREHPCSCASSVNSLCTIEGLLNELGEVNIK